MQHVRGPIRRWSEALWYMAAVAGACWLGLVMEEDRYGGVLHAFGAVLGVLVLAQMVFMIGRPRSRIIGWNDLWRVAIGTLAWWIGRTLHGVFGTIDIVAPALGAFVFGIVLAGPLHIVRHPARKFFAWWHRWFDEEGGEVWRRRTGWFIDRERFFFPPCAAALLVIAAPALAAPYAQRYFIGKYAATFNDVVTRKYAPAESTHVLARDGISRICTFMIQDREVVSIKDIPLRLQQAFMSAEDRTFGLHYGMDMTAIVRAFVANVVEMWIKQRITRKLQGGSTITQQVVKQLVIKSKDRTFNRKLTEAFLAPALERELSRTRLAAIKRRDEFIPLPVKEQILELYLNYNYLGGGAHGVLVAARRLFGKNLDDLSLGEMAIIAGMAKAPGDDSPDRNPTRAKERRTYVLGRMVEDGYVTLREAEIAASEPIEVLLPGINSNQLVAPHFCEHVRLEVRRVLDAKLGKKAAREKFYGGGLEILTTLDLDFQKRAMSAIAIGLLDLERRQGFSSPKGHDKHFRGVCVGDTVSDDVITEAKVVAVHGDQIEVCVGGERLPLDGIDVENIRKWESGGRRKLLVGHVLPVRVETRTEERKVRSDGQPHGRLEMRTVQVRYALTAFRNGDDKKEPLQAGLIAVDPKTGELLVEVGGYLIEDAFNIAWRAQRQAGSAIKPIGPYAAALRKGVRPDATIVDRPRSYPSCGHEYAPQNYEGKFHGLVPLRKAMAESHNSVAVELCAGIAGLSACMQSMKDLGIVSHIEPCVPVAAGAVDLTLTEITYAYASIASWGHRMPRHEGNDKQPGYFIREIRERTPGTRGPLTAANSRVLWPSSPAKLPEELGQAIPSGVAYGLIYLMRGVTATGGTAWRLRDFGRDVFGKTGTTNRNMDAWFIGCTPDMCTGVWVGRTNKAHEEPISGGKATGGTIALPIWTAFMEGVKPSLPKRRFPIPWDVRLHEDKEGKLVPIPISDSLPMPRLSEDNDGETQ